MDFCSLYWPVEVVSKKAISCFRTAWKTRLCTEVWIRLMVTLYRRSQKNSSTALAKHMKQLMPKFTTICVSLTKIEEVKVWGLNLNMMKGLLPGNSHYCHDGNDLCESIRCLFACDPISHLSCVLRNRHLTCIQDIIYRYCSCHHNITHMIISTMDIICLLILICQYSFFN